VSRYGVWLMQAAALGSRPGQRKATGRLGADPKSPGRQGNEAG